MVHEMIAHAFNASNPHTRGRHSDINGHKYTWHNKNPISRGFDTTSLKYVKATHIRLKTKGVFKKKKKKNEPGHDGSHL